jgi:predicted RNA-binding protein with PUA-like domain
MGPGGVSTAALATRRLPRQDRAMIAKKTSSPTTKSPAKKGTRKSPAKESGPKPIVSTGYWLFKSEPDVFSYEMLKAKGARGEPWTGVRNFLARNNMRAMSVGDLGFFYHSNIGKEIVGICRVIAPAHPDPEDGTGTWDCVDVESVTDFSKPVTLEDVKNNPKLQTMSLVTSMRLSVQPVTADEWIEVCRMAGFDPKDLPFKAVGAKKQKR